ncbi:hypothetical protein DL93DRAFT_1845524 [Clavulina sp. PMI_390]|nr:hypothetical protein DL93DRAFT_1845524 [Clavulina sp. PMI_390]
MTFCCYLTDFTARTVADSALGHQNCVSTRRELTQYLQTPHLAESGVASITQMTIMLMPFLVLLLHILAFSNAIHCSTSIQLISLVPNKHDIRLVM